MVDAQMLTWPMSFGRSPMERDGQSDICHVFDMSTFNYPSPLSEENSISPKHLEDFTATEEHHEWTPGEGTFTMLSEGNLIIIITSAFDLIGCSPPALSPAPLTASF